MSVSPHQTHLSERLQSAKGFGWPMPPEQEERVPSVTGVRPPAGVALPVALFRAVWLRVVG